MLISSGVLVSDCHGAVIYMEGSEYHCMKCLGRCNSAGTLGEQYERDNAIPKERARLEREVIEAVKPWRKLLAEITTALTSQPISEDLVALNQRRVDAEVALIAATDALIEFESQHGIETKD